jgi:hypothetical protein
MGAKGSRGSILGGAPPTDLDDSPVDPGGSLTNHLLIAMPSLADPNFS